MKVIITPPELAGAVWPVIRPFVDRVVAKCRGRRTAFDTLRELLAGETVLWVIYDEKADATVGFATGRICRYDDFSLLGVELVGGDGLDSWEDPLMETLTAFAKDQGCSGLEGYGRGAAWARKLRRKYNWRPVFTTVELLFEEDEK